MSGFAGIISVRAHPTPEAFTRVCGPLMRTTGLEGTANDARLCPWQGEGAWLAYSHLAAAHVGESPAQPCTLDGVATIVGHILLVARAQLVEELERAGVAATLEMTDATLVLNAYRVWKKESFAQHLDGEFSFAIWDAAERILVCVRDRWGVRPLYYAHLPTGLVFSNRLSAVLAHADVDRTPNEVAIGDFLVTRFNLDHATTSFRGVSRLPPAHVLEFAQGSARAWRYYTAPLDGVIRYPREADYADHLLDLLGTAVSERLADEGTAGIRMSGGMDSTSVAAAAVRFSPRVALKAFTVTGPLVMPSDREGELATETAAHLRIPIELVDVDAAPLFGWDSFDADPELHDESTDLVGVELRRRMRAHSSVILSGDSGDHVFLPPYDHFTRALRRGRLPGFARDAVRFVRLFRYLPPLGLRTAVRRVRGTPAWPVCALANPAFAREMSLAHRYERATAGNAIHRSREYAYGVLTSPLAASAFERDYALSASTGCDSRHAFADTRLVEYLLAVPGFPWMFHKTILREAMRGLLPERVRTRRKTPLADPLVPALLRHHGGDFSFVHGAPRVHRYVDVQLHPRSVRPGMPLGSYLSDTSAASLARWLQRVKDHA